MSSLPKLFSTLGMQISISDAQFNGTSCGIDATTKVKGLCHNKDRCQLYASQATIGNSGCPPGTATLVVEYSCKGEILSVRDKYIFAVQPLYWEFWVNCQRYVSFVLQTKFCVLSGALEHPLTCFSTDPLSSRGAHV